MQLNVPFYANDGDGSQCGQVTVRTAIKYFLNKDFSLQELDKITDRKTGYWTWTTQMASALHDFGLKVKYYSKENLEPYLQGEQFIRKHFGKDAEQILKHTDLPILMKSIHTIIGQQIFEKKELSLEDIESHLSKGHVPIVCIDWNKTVGREGLFAGHYVVATGFDKENIYYHEAGPTNPTANKKLLKKIFIEAWNANGTDNDVIIVFGKR